MELACDICCEEVEVELVFWLTDCSHFFCQDCLITYAEILVENCQPDMPCPNFECDVKISPSDIHRIIRVANPEDGGGVLESRWERLIIRKALARESNAVWCPEVACSFAAIVEAKKHGLHKLFSKHDGTADQITCEDAECRTEFCTTCGIQTEKHNTSENDPGKLICPKGAKKSDFIVIDKDSFNSQLVANGGKLRLGRKMGPHVRSCPACYMPTSKDGGCNFVKCPLCGCQFCWFCGQETKNACFLHWAAFCSLRTDRLSRRFKQYSSKSWIVKFGAIITLVLLGLIALPLLVTWTVICVLPFHLWADWFHSSESPQRFKIPLLVLLLCLFYPIFVLISPILWILLYLDCLCDVGHTIMGLLCPGRSSQRTVSITVV